MKPNFCTPLPDQRTWHHIALLQEVILTSTSEKRIYLMNNSEESQRRGHSCPICTICLFRYVEASLSKAQQGINNVAIFPYDCK